MDFSKQQKGEEIKVLILKQMFQKFPIVLPLVKVGYKSRSSENLLNEIRQTIYSFYRKKRSYYKGIKQYNKFIEVIKQNDYYIYEF